MTPSVLLETSALLLKTSQRVLLDDLTWQVHAGECWCIIGRNGAGKSSLLRSIAGLREVDGGSVALQGKPLSAWALPALARARSYLPQSRSDPFAYSVIETVLSARFPHADVHYWESDEDIQLANQALEQMDVLALAQRDIRTLSGGERQRVAIAALLAQSAPLMLLDEPANALDLAHQISVMHWLQQLCTQQKKAVVMVSHDLNMAHQFASHVLLMMGDGPWLAGTKEQVMEADKLTRCLGQAIVRIEHQGRTLFLPA
jgi:iron complex transport system ATP-binding protein